MRILPEFSSLFLGLAIGGAAFVSTSNASSILFDLNEFTGDNTTASAEVSELGGDQFKVTVNNTPDVDGIGDITGIFFDFSSGLTQNAFSNFEGASIGSTFSPITLEDFGTGTSNLGGGVNLNGNGNSDGPGIFDYGLRFPGFDIDDIQSIMFTVDATGLGATLTDFTRFGLRLQSVGVFGASRNGSSKLVSGEPTLSVMPLPATWLLLIAGLGGLGIVGRHRRRMAV